MDYYTQSVGDVLSQLDTSRAGLASTEVAERQREYGTNSVSIKTVPLYRRLIEPFASVFMFILVIAAGISFWRDSVVDGVIILIVIIVSAIIDYIQQFSTERIIRSLRRKQAYRAYAKRDGSWQLIDTDQLVPGDIVEVNEGDKVPADLRIIEVRGLRANESQLTGESESINKQARELSSGKELYEQSNMLFQGSFIIAGQAVCVVTSIGNATEYGKLAALSAGTITKNPVAERIDRLVSILVIAVAVIALVAFLLAIGRGMDPVEALRFVIALTVSVIPEGLPVAISVILAVAMYRLAKRNALVRSMSAVESIGVITSIATDKTGTLTKNKLTVQELWSPSGDISELSAKLHRCVVTNERTTDPLDEALVAHIHRHRLGLIEKPPLVSYAFEHTAAMSGNIWHYGDEYELYVKGAPEAILEHAHVSESESERINQSIQYYAGLGFRVIAVGHTRLAHKPSSLKHLSKKHDVRLIFDGLLAVADALRPEARPAIARAMAAGISVRMITGDHLETAFHIARELGLTTSRAEVFDSRDMRLMSDKDLSAVISSYNVFARVTPERKHRILTLLKQHDVVAMTGDGINDVPALTSAHVGIAMNSGSDIAKDASDIILVDDNFRSIIGAVHEGRTVYANIKRMVAYLVSTNLGEALISIISLALGYPIPLVPIQILWVNLVTDTTMVIPLGLEPPRRSIMRRPPLASTAPLFSKFMLSRIILVAAFITWMVASIYITYTNSYGVDYGRTAAFTSLVAIQWASALCFRSDYEPIWKRLLTKNAAFWIGLAISIILQALAIFSPLAGLLHVARISYGDFFAITGISTLLPIILIELHKFVGRRYFHKG